MILAAVGWFLIGFAAGIYYMLRLIRRADRDKR